MKPEMEFTASSSDDFKWVPVVEDVTGHLQELVLARSDESSVYTRLLRFQEGCDTTPNGVMQHDFWEEVWILSGSIRDLRLDREFSQGSYACRPPGMAHGPWASTDGAITFEVRYRTHSAARLDAGTQLAE